jgi:DNA-binding MarR family transcriptional regulator
MVKPEHQFLLPQLTALHSRLQAAFSRAVGLHLSRFRVLYMLYVLGESSPGALLRLTTMDAAALTRVLKDFEAQGLIVRRTAPGDGRQKLAALTPAGLSLVQERLGARDRFIVDALAGLTDAEAQALSQLLGKVEANVSRLAGLPAVGATLNIDAARPKE